MLNYKIIKKKFPANNSYITAITIIPVKRNINQFLNGDFARLKEVGVIPASASPGAN